MEEDKDELGTAAPRPRAAFPAGVYVLGLLELPLDELILVLIAPLRPCTVFRVHFPSDGLTAVVSTS